MATSAESLDAGDRMSALFEVNIETQRAEREFATLDEALARLRRLNKSIPYTANSGVVIRPRSSRASNRDNSFTRVFQDKVLQRVEIKTQNAMAESMEMGAKLVKRNLRFAITEYGMYRYLQLGRGRSAGRDDTGKMIDSVVWNTQRTVSNTVSRRKTVILAGQRNARVIGFFGWDKPEVYMVAQEKGFVLANAGTGKGKPKNASRAYVFRFNGKTRVEGAKALGEAMVETRNHLINQLKKG